jgi:dCMP deaminase
METEMKNNRPLLPSERKDWDRYFLDIAKLVAKQSTCPLKHVGAVLVKDRRILSMGYNGVPRGIRHICEDERKCLRLEQNTKDYSKCPGMIHAEVNAVVTAAYFGISTNGSICYCEYFPCKDCIAVLINAGVTGIVYEKPPVDDLAQKLALDAGMTITKILPDKKIKITYLNLDEVVK